MNVSNNYPQISAKSRISGASTGKSRMSLKSGSQGSGIIRNSINRNQQ